MSTRIDKGMQVASTDKSMCQKDCHGMLAEENQWLSEKRNTAKNINKKQKPRDGSRAEL